MKITLSKLKLTLVNFNLVLVKLNDTSSTIKITSGETKFNRVKFFFKNYRHNTGIPSERTWDLCRSTDELFARNNCVSLNF